jgi:hypothetical protein
MRTTYGVDVGGHVLEVSRDDETGEFDWDDVPANRCLTDIVRLRTRISMVAVRAADGLARMIAFDNDGEHDCGILTLMLYLCARGHTVGGERYRGAISNQQLRNLLMNHIEEALDVAAFPGEPRTYRQLFRDYGHSRADHRLPGVPTCLLLLQAFCDVFGVSCQTWRSENFPTGTRHPRVWDLYVPGNGTASHRRAHLHYWSDLQTLRVGGRVLRAGHARLLGTIVYSCKTRRGSS